MGQQFAVPGSAPGGLNALAPLAGMPSKGFNNLATPAAPPLAAPAVMPVAQTPTAPTTFAEAEAQRQARVAAQAGATTLATENAKNQAKAQNALPSIEESTRNVESIISGLIGNTKIDAKGRIIKDPNAPPHPGFEAAVGQSVSKLLTKEPIAGTDRADFMSRLKQAQGGAFLDVYNTLRGAGGISEKEGEKGTAAINRMNEATSEKEFIMAADDFRNWVRRNAAIARQQAAGGTAPAGGNKSNAVDTSNPFLK
jgi:hypothetical protein